MKYIKLLPALLLAFMLSACGNGDETAGERMDKAIDETEDAMEEVGDETSDAMDEMGDSMSEAGDEMAEGMDEAGDEMDGEGAWEKTKEGAKEAWVATKEFSMEAWKEVRESFKGDMSPAEKQKYDECVTRLQKVEGATKDQAERGCWRMMEEDTTEDYYAEEPDSDIWADTKEGAREAWDATKEGAKEAWSATKEYSQEAWNEVSESFKGDMTAEQKASFDACVKRLQDEEGLTKKQAERGCWRMMEEAADSEESMDGEG